ncbi:MAG: protein translocase subunit SecF [Magnetococcales bacterium]|nr:protein translocase subunit SecF [Magnetococcales bacterium]
MELIHKRTHIDFVKLTPYSLFLSAVILIAGLVSYLYQGLNYGIDFSGGISIQLRFDAPAPIGPIRSSLDEMHLGDVVIQEFGSPNEVLLRIEAQKDESRKQSELAKEIVRKLAPLNVAGKDLEVRRVEFVGPQVGSELAWQGIMAVLYSLVAILIYVGWRFEWRFALGAVLALFHDVLCTVGLFSILQEEFTLTIVAALLTILGYSINDTIVVYDRIRDEMMRLKSAPMAVVINEAINLTLSRTIITSGTVVLVLLGLFFVGGEVIHGFALALLFGVGLGTLSSVFVAAPVVLLLDPYMKSGRRMGSKEVAEGEQP